MKTEVGYKYNDEHKYDEYYEEDELEEWEDDELDDWDLEGCKYEVKLDVDCNVWNLFDKVCNVLGITTDKAIQDLIIGYFAMAENIMEEKLEMIKNYENLYSDVLKNSKEYEELKEKNKEFLDVLNQVKEFNKSQPI